MFSCPYRPPGFGGGQCLALQYIAKDQASMYPEVGNNVAIKQQMTG